MSNIIKILSLSLFLVLVACGVNNNTSSSTLPTYIGEAKILKNGTIVVHSFIQELNGEEAHAQIITEYKTDDPNYEIVKKHIGDITVGETKLVRPFN